jgi:hypothetical protein
VVDVEFLVERGSIKVEGGGLFWHAETAADAWDEISVPDASSRAARCSAATANNE